MINLGARVRRGALWVAVAQVLRQALNWGTLTILARLVPPSEFGLLGMALVFAGLTAVLRDFGVGAATVQAKEMSHEGLSTVYWGALAVGVVAAVAFFLSAPLIAGIYDEPRLVLIVRVLSVNFISACGMSVHFSVLDRQLKFGTAAALELAAATIGSGLAITLAAMGYGVWSLVVQLVGQGVASLTLAHVFVKWRPRRVFDRGEVSGVGRYSAYLTGFQSANYLARNADYFLIGYLFGPTSLGFYTIGYRVVFQLVQTVSSVAVRVLFPVLSRLQDDMDRLRSSYLRATALALAGVMPVMVTLGVFAEVAVRIVLGPQWESVVPLLQLFVPTALIQIVMTLVGTVYQASGRTDLLFYWGIGSSLVTVTGFVIGLEWGIEGVAAAYAITNLLLLPVGLWIPLRLIGLDLRDMVVRLSPIAAAGSAQLGCLLFLPEVSASEYGSAAISVTCGLAVYGLALSKLAPHVIADIGMISAFRRRVTRS